MTALEQYERLEATAIWRETPQDQRRAVIVSFGDATLVIADERSARALAHWSLSALVRRNPGKRPALFAPSEEPGEELEISDTLMLEAIEKVQANIEARRPHPGRLRRLGWAFGGGLLALGGLFWLPDALVTQAARVAPPAKARDIANTVLDDLSKLTGTPCHSTAGDAALEALAARLPGVTGIAVLPKGLSGARMLPGGMVALGRDTLSGPDTPEVAAGAILAAQLAQEPQAPLQAAIAFAGPVAALKLLTTGDLPAGSLAGYGRQLLQTSSPLPEQETLLAAFAEAGVSSTPFAYAHDPSGESVLGLIEADPFKGAPAPRPVLIDDEWLALKDMCL